MEHTNNTQCNLSPKAVHLARMTQSVIGLQFALLIN